MCLAKKKEKRDETAFSNFISFGLNVVNVFGHFFEKDRRRSVAEREQSENYLFTL